MVESPGFLNAVRGSGIGYLLALGCILGLLVLRQVTSEPATRRRALVAVVFFLVFALLRLPLHFLAAEVPGPKGTPVPNPFHQVLEAVSLIVFAWALIQGLLLLLVDFMLVGRLKMEIPRIVSDVALIAIFLVSVLVILYYRTDLDITGVFTTAGVVSIVIGLALQDTLGNVFAGLSLQMERPFKVGDWVSFGEFEGVITDVSWRSTQFRTRNNDLVTVPNSTVSKDSFVNHSAPSRVSGRLVYVGVHYRHPPAEVKRVLLDACAQVPEILDRPQPLVRLKAFDASSITYEIKFWIKDFAAVPDIEEHYRTTVWYAFQREGIEIPYPIQVQYDIPLEPEEERRAVATGHVLTRLRDVEMLAPLSDEELRTLSSRTKLHAYNTGETIIREGEEGDSFFVLDRGEVTVCVSKDGHQEEVARLHPPAPFGEMSLLTGERRSATVRAASPVQLLVVDREAFKSIIIANPDLATAMSDILVQRQVELLASREALDKSLAASRDEASRQIVNRIREFFGFAAVKPAKRGVTSSGDHRKPSGGNE